MEEHTVALLAALKKPSTAVDQKLALFTNLKSDIKHSRVPESCQAPIFECLRLAITTTTSAALVSTGFSTLSHFIKRLVLQNQTAVITSQLPKLLPILLERLGDVRETHRNAASSILADLWPLSHADVESLIRDNAIKGSNARAKEASMQWVVKMNHSAGLPFRTFVPALIANLEDADAGVRETAKTAVVELFRNAPEHAKVNLKKQLVQFNVRKTIASYIISQLDTPTMMVEAEMPPHPPRPISVARAHSLQPESGIADSMLSEVGPAAEVVPMDPIHVFTQRELDDIFRDMASCFEGKETEHNWSQRDKNTLKLRRITKGNAPAEFHVSFVAGIKGLLDGILKVCNSLRTTMSSNGCQLVQDLARTLGPSMDPWSEILLQNFVKMCAATKNIAAQNGNATVDTIFSSVSYSKRLLDHLTFASQDKNVQPRIYSAGWFKTLIRKHKGPLEHTGGMEVLEKTLKRGLTDANPKVREAYRSTYWTFALIWPQKAEAIFATLDKREKTGLEKDPNNPNAPLVSSQSSASSFSKSVGPGGPASARNALKEKIAEQRRAKLAAAKGVPDRPNSAQASYTPLKTQSSKSLGSKIVSNASSASSATARPPSALSGSTKAVAGSNAGGTGSLLSGTVRRPVRPRPELTRPATADPYATRRPAKNVTSSMTPERTPASTVKKSVAPKSTVRSRAQTQSSSSVSPIGSKSRPADTTAHEKTPSVSSRHASPAVSPGKGEDLTLVKPFARSKSHHEPGVLPFRERVGLDKPTTDADALDLGDDDNFTMVIPNLARPTSQGPQRSPPKPTASPARLSVASPRPAGMKSPHPIGVLQDVSLPATRSPRMPSPERPSTRGTDSVEDGRVYDDPFVGEETLTSTQGMERRPLGELSVNEHANERRQTIGFTEADAVMSESTEEHNQGRQKTTSIASNTTTESNDASRSEVLKNRQLLASGINKIKSRTVEAHMFRRLQDMVKSNQDIWGTDDEKFGELLLASLDYLEAPPDSLKAPIAKTANLKVQALATIRAMLSLYRKETAKYFSRVLCTLLRTKAQYDNTSHIATDLEATADEIVKYGQTSNCIDAVLSLLEDSGPSMPGASTTSKGPENTMNTASNRTVTMGLVTLASLIAISAEKSVTLSDEQTSRLGRLAVKCLDDVDADVRKADVELCLALHRRIGSENEAFWKVVAGAREQHLNLLTYYLAKRKASVAEA
ncbi:uncharacterized protein EI97DRAFT_391888 [Westerdykella ornata]|uniref:TOG domain-containing protein n=1 Tax=Westerdykella ornata TaxID=318751 RepID=A0A6A6JRM1_WESOR|nr:uncharacterized protein EI97DRAFT_391888 [Westerdykella ornata]KAF2279212.1 hypothetical protein EI97DRAFT_391888 [Westerdykella ornata]